MAELVSTGVSHMCDNSTVSDKLRYNIECSYELYNNIIYI